MSGLAISLAVLAIVALAACLLCVDTVIAWTRRRK